MPYVNPVDVERALRYMGLAAGTAITEIPVEVVFIGSCTNSRIEDLGRRASVLKGKRVASGVRVLVVPGSQRVRVQGEREGLDRIFNEAGCEWRNAGCRMCLAMNPDQLHPVSAPRAPATGTSRDGRGRAAVRTWSAR